MLETSAVDDEPSEELLPGLALVISNASVVSDEDALPGGAAVVPAAEGTTASSPHATNNVSPIHSARTPTDYQPVRGEEGATPTARSATALAPIVFVPLPLGSHAVDVLTTA